MITVVSGTLHERQFVQQFADPMYRQRYKVFYERLGWQVSVANGKEVDEFDDQDSVYLLTTSYTGRVIGGWRLRPTMRPYMLSKVFPQLLYGAKAPMDRSIWEISRFAVEADVIEADVIKERGPSFGFGHAARALLAGTVEFAVRVGMTQCVMVVSVALERLLRSFGLRLHRFGPPMRIGHVMSVAVWLDVDLHTRSTLFGEPIPMLAAA
jgi:acyl homoserine lactone synthase